MADPSIGFLLFFVLGLGLGLPYILLAIAANRMGHLPRAGPWLLWSKQALGVLLLGLALYFLRPLLPDWAGALAMIGLLTGAGVYLGWLERASGTGRTLLTVKRIVGAGLLAVAILLAWPRAGTGPAVPWIPYSEAALMQARLEGRPALVDVYADWCLPCVEMDHVTFRHPNVVRALEPVAALRLDVTRGVPPDGEALLIRYDVFGAPTVLLFDRSGRERSDLRLLGFVKPDEFLSRLAQMLGEPAPAAPTGQRP
jgi:thiol:disulfide interchange protein DsbD